MNFPFPRSVVERVLEEDGWEETVKIRDNYVGRGQSQKCVGFVTSYYKYVVHLLLRLAGETEAEGVDLDDLLKATDAWQIDNFGKQEVIVYFPGYEFLEEE